MTDQELIALAIEARKNAYTPYSHYQVGVALLAQSGNVYQGCNIENAAYTPSNCGERTAFFKAVSQGERKFTTIAIVAGKEDGELEDTAPCGVCRQVMMEFCDPETFRIVLATSPEQYKVWTLKSLLPMGFGPANLK
jgi:cytidine deaminase